MILYQISLWSIESLCANLQNAQLVRVSQYSVWYRRYLDPALDVVSVTMTLTRAATSSMLLIILGREAWSRPYS